MRCAEGRFRLDAGYVSDGAGNTLGRNDKGEVAFAINPNNMTAPEQLGDHGLPASPKAEPAKVAPFDPASFIAHVREVVGKQPQAATVAIQSADRAKPFQGPRAIATAAPKEPTVQPASRQHGSAFDQWEAEQLKANGGNPVVDSKMQPRR